MTDDPIRTLREALDWLPGYRAEEQDEARASLEQVGRVIEAAKNEVAMWPDSAPALRRALEPFGTTDSCPDCSRPESVNHTKFEGVGWMKRSGVGDDAGWTDCTTDSPATPADEGRTTDE